MNAGGSFEEGDMKHTTCISRRFAVGVAFVVAGTGSVWGNGMEFFTAPPVHRTATTLIYFGRVKDSRTGRRTKSACLASR